MAYTIVKILIYLAIAFVSFLVFKMTLSLLSSLEGTEDRIESAIEYNLKEKNNFFNLRLKLSQLGIMYRLKNYRLQPTRYIMLKIFCAALAAAIVFLFAGFKVIFIALAGVLGYFVLDFYFTRQNKSDNDKILNDIFNIYLTLKIQLSSNIYIIDALQACKNIVQNERLKEALDELVVNMSNKAITYKEAIETFKNRFKSDEIINLCAFMFAYAQYGVSDKYIEDIMSEINEISTASAIKDEHNIESKVGFYTFLYFAAIVAVVVFGALQTVGNIDIFS